MLVLQTKYYGGPADNFLRATRAMLTYEARDDNVFTTLRLVYLFNCMLAEVGWISSITLI